LDKDFWRKKWLNGDIGFHQGEVNPYLIHYCDELALQPADQVFVPLCGKSQDMIWLAQRGYKVLGVEASELAVEAFFEKSTLPVEQRHHRGFDLRRSNGIEVWCGDFFKLDARDLKGVRGVFDRASLVAMPPALRRSYVHQMAAIIEPGARTLLVTMEYDCCEMDGPPFPVDEATVRKLYEGAFTVQLLGGESVLDQHQRFRERGVSRLCERSYLLQRR